MEPYKIEKHIPVPRSKGKWNNLPLAQMAIGESIFIPNLFSRASIVRYLDKAKPKTFTTRTEDGGLRIWRVS